MGCDPLKCLLMLDNDQCFLTHTPPGTVVLPTIFNDENSENVPQNLAFERQ